MIQCFEVLVTDELVLVVYAEMYIMGLIKIMKPTIVTTNLLCFQLCLNAYLLCTIADSDINTFFDDLSTRSDCLVI